jgi:hypothetical protein
VAISLTLGELGGLVLATAAPLREAANQGASPADQLAVSGNACGPAALLNAFRFGDANWQRAAAMARGDSDKAQLLAIIRTWGLRPSAHLSGRLRWTRQGVNVDDLCDMANEMTRGQVLPQVVDEVFILQPGESAPELLRRVHTRLASSLARGLPPVISLRRVALRSQAGKPPSWVVVQGHFVTVTGVPRKLDRHAASFSVTYVDPWGGKRGEGRLSISQRAFLSGQAPASAVSPCLQADFPQANVGKELLRTAEFSVLTLAAAIGKW